MAARPILRPSPNDRPARHVAWRVLQRRARRLYVRASHDRSGRRPRPAGLRDPLCSLGHRAGRTHPIQPSLFLSVLPHTSTSSSSIMEAVGGCADATSNCGGAPPLLSIRTSDEMTRSGALHADSQAEPWHQISPSVVSRRDWRSITLEVRRVTEAPPFVLLFRKTRPHRRH